MGSIISPKLAPKLITFSVVCSFALVLVTGDKPGFVRSMDRGLLGLSHEQFSYIHVYWHDIVSGPKPTSVPIMASTSNTSATGFGYVSMIDDPLTEGPLLGSKLVGRAQGFYASASQQEVGLLMVMNFAFTEGKYTGSTITILGRNTVFSKVREMPVIGGSGVFRFARGYVQARTYRFDANTGDAVVEYNIYVSHY